MQKNYKGVSVKLNQNR